MVTDSATIVVYEAGYVEHLRLDTADPEGWLRTVLGAGTLGQIMLGPQMRLYFDSSHSGAVNPVAEQVLGSYPAELSEIRGPIAFCRYEQRGGKVHDLFVAQVDRINERFCAGLPVGNPAVAEPRSAAAESDEALAGHPMCSLLIPPILPIAEIVNIPSAGIEEWIAARLGKPSASVEPRRLAPGTLMLFASGSKGRNFTAGHICTAFHPLQRTYVFGPALICREDPDTGQLGDLHQDQIRALMDRYSALKGPLGERITEAYLRSLYPKRLYETPLPPGRAQYYGPAPETLGKGKLGFRLDRDDESPSF